MPFYTQQITEIFSAHTLQKFAKDNFRLPSSNGSSLNGADDNLKHQTPELWRHSRAPLSEPLLKKLEGRVEPSKEALLSFTCIQRYMGDLPLMAVPPPVYFLESTDLIFRAPLKYVRICIGFLI